MSVRDDTAAKLTAHNTSIASIMTAKDTDTLELASVVDTNIQIIKQLTQERADATNKAAEAERKYEDHMTTVHPVTPPTPPVPAKFKTMFGLGGGNVVRSGIAIDRRYYSSGDLAKLIKDSTANETKGIVSWNSMKMPYAWPEMSKGAGDDWANTVFKAEIEAMKPKIDDADDVDIMYKSIHHEPEGDGDEDDWRITQDRIAHILNKLDPDMKIIKYWLTTTGWGQEFDAQRVPNEVDWETNLFPHGAPIYGIAYDAPYQKYGYEWLNGTKTATLDKTWTNPVTYIDALAKRGVQFNCEVAVGEWGYSDEAFAKDKTWALQVMDRCAVNPYKQLRAATYFDTPLNSKRSWYLGAADSQKRKYMQALMDNRRAA